MEEKKEKQEKPLVDKRMPQSYEAEVAVLASILLDSEKAEEILELVETRFFFDPKHRCIFLGLLKLKEKNHPLDTVALSTYLLEVGLIERAGGVEYISSLINSIPNSARAFEYIEILKEKAMLRAIISAGGNISNLGYRLDDDIDSLISEAQKITSSLSDEYGNNEITPIASLIESHIKHQEEIANQNLGEVTGVPSGFIELDNITGGFQKSDLIIIAGRASMGKTSLGISILLNAARNERNYNCVFFSLEMNKEQIAMRFISAIAKIPFKHLLTGKLNSDENNRYVSACELLSKLNIYIDDTSRITVDQIKAKCRKLYNSGKLDLIVVDYLQIMGFSKALRNSVREQQVSEISRGLKGLAKEFHVPVIALAQVGRAVEKQENKRPQLSDLRESGAIEQDADLIIFVYRDEYYNKDSFLKDIGEVIIRKHRNGALGNAFINYESNFAYFNKDKVYRKEEINELIEATEAQKKKSASKVIKKSKKESVDEETGEVY